MTDETPADTAPSLSHLIIPLLKGVIYQENDGVLWGSLLSLQARVRDYVTVLGLELILDEAEGYAFLRSRPQTDDNTLPRLVARRPLSYPVSLILALLREKLAEFDASGGDTRLVLTGNEIAEIVRVFLPETSNEARWADQLETHLNKIADMGFMRRLKTTQGGRDTPTFEVRRILKAFVDAQWLADLSAKLAALGAPSDLDMGEDDE